MNLLMHMFIFQTSIQEWRLVFWVAAIILSLSAVFYCIWASGEVQSWNEPKSKKEMMTQQ